MFILRDVMDVRRKRLPGVEPEFRLKNRKCKVLLFLSYEVHIPVFRFCELFESAGLIPCGDESHRPCIAIWTRAWMHASSPDRTFQKNTVMTQRASK